MSIKMVLKKIQALWKWILSGVIAITGGIVAIIHWLVGTAATTAVVKTAVVGTATVAAAAFSFNFGDKGNEILTHLEKGYALASEGKNTEAIEYTQKLVKAYDNHINELQEKTSPASQPTSASSNDPEFAKIEESIRKGLMRKEIIQLALADISENTENVAPDVWCQRIGDTLINNATQSKQIISEYLSIKRNTYPVDGLWDILKLDIPLDAKGAVAEWLAKNSAPTIEEPLDKHMQFYGQLLNDTAKSEFAPELLETWVRAIDELALKANRAKCRKAVEDVLETYITLFPNSNLGVRAVLLQLGGIESEKERENKILKLVQDKSGSLVAKALYPAYILTRLRQGKYRQAIAMVDEEKILASSDNEKEAVQNLLYLAHKAYALKLHVPKRIGHKEEDKPAQDKLSVSEIATGLANELYWDRQYSVSSQLSLLLLQKTSHKPINLITKQSIRDLTELGYTGDEISAKAVCEYLLALSKLKPNTKSNHKQIYFLPKVDVRSLPKTLQAYVLEKQARSSAAAKNYELACQQIESATAILSSSPILVSLKTKILQDQQTHEMRERIEQERKYYMDLADNTANSREAIEYYNKVAELCLALEEREQAIGIYLLAVDRFPDDSHAPRLLSNCIRLLESSAIKSDANRVKSIKDKLVKVYPDSEEAKELGTQKMDNKG